MNNDDLEFSNEERRALETWKAAEPPPDFAERVLARAQASAGAVAPARRLGFVHGLAVAAAIVAIAFFARGMFVSQAASGSIAAKERATVAIGSRGVAVAEAGAALRWEVASNGEARVEQAQGNTFYRIERGGPFVVHTPAGEVRVVGTCFRVEVEDMKASSAGLLGAGAGAALATTVLVSVYEGRVVTASPNGAAVELAAGESARLGGESAPAKVLVRREGPRRGGEDRAEGAISERTELALRPLPEGLDARQLYEAHAKLQREAQAMKTELETLRAKAGDREGPKMFDIEPEELKRMADRCELRWDMQPLRAEPDTLGPRQVEKLKLSEAERETIDRALKANHERIVKQLREIYVEVTGDNSPGSPAPMSMFEEINEQAPKGEMQRVFQKLARERAGLQPPPVDEKGQSAWERVFRLMTTAGDSLEALVAKELGPETARAHRALHGGYGSRSRSSSGCPGENPGDE